KFALAVPVIGGALMVAVLLGDDLNMIIGQGVRSAADLIIGALFSAPSALWGFFGAIGLVAVGGSIVMYVIKSGPVAVIVESDRVAGDVHQGPVHVSALRHAYAYDLGLVLDASRRFARRSTVLAAGLSVAYAAIGGGYFFALAMSLRLAERTTWAPA